MRTWVSMVFVGLSACTSVPTRTAFVFLNATSKTDVFVVESLDGFPSKQLAHTNVWIVETSRSVVVYDACFPLGFVTPSGSLPFFELRDITKKTADGLPVIEVDLSNAASRSDDSVSEAERDREMRKRVDEYKESLPDAGSQKRTTCYFPK